MSVHRRCAVGDESPSLPTHVGTGLLLEGRSCPAQFSFGGYSVLKRMFVLLIAGSTTRGAPGSTRTDSVGRASIAPSSPSFKESSAQKGDRLSIRLFEKSRDPCWDKSCRLEGSSEQLLSFAIHLTWEFYLVTETEGCQFTYLLQ